MAGTSFGKQIKKSLGKLKRMIRKRGKTVKASCKKGWVRVKKRVKIVKRSFKKGWRNKVKKKHDHGGVVGIGVTVHVHAG